MSVVVGEFGKSFRAFGVLGRLLGSKQVLCWRAVGEASSIFYLAGTWSERFRLNRKISLLSPITLFQ
jgi:hypothetical protein